MKRTHRAYRHIAAAASRALAAGRAGASTRFLASLVSGPSLGLGLLAFALPAASGPLAPKRLLDLRVVAGTSSSPPCPGGFEVRRVDTQQNPDGTTSPFSIPSGSAFVVTSWDWLAQDVESGLAGVDLAVVDGAGTSLSIISHGRAPTAETPGGGTRAGGGTVATAAGAAVASGSHLCAASNGKGYALVVRGFLAAERPAR
jgi:hypothetical protein